MDASKRAAQRLDVTMFRVRQSVDKGGHRAGERMVPFLEERPEIDTGE
jgi:hypothetical protein